jgi:uncharacterized membrane protein
MTIGPVQLIVLGFNSPDFRGEIIEELERLRKSDTVRVIDSLAVYKTKSGELKVKHLSNLTRSEAIEVGSTIGALIGLSLEGETGAARGAAIGAEEAAKGTPVLDEAIAWDVVTAIPEDTAAAFILLEHHWAVPLREAISRAGGFRINDTFVSPMDLVAVGLHTAEEARRMQEQELFGSKMGL